ncbi:MAG: thioredoxin-disulfide reductase [Candidatus Thermoplasmatota archaeon]|nr:thioredoxin-disulfide reductase [Candidatus Thermoplasmatota archaeon]
MFDLAIIGAGPAGFAAGIYAGRSGLRTVILEKQMAGGQVVISPLIENWPGEKEISGPDLSMKFREHARRYVEIREFSEVVSVTGKKPFIITTPEGEVKAKALIIATGAEHRKLGVPGEEALGGRGISYCATCDGFFFKGKDVMVIGGGSTALLYAIYLHNIDCNVKLVHRRDEFRGEKALQDQVRSLKIELVLNTKVEEFIGDEQLEGVRLRNVKNGEVSEMKVNGAFVAVGEIPMNEIARSLGIKLDSEGYIKVDRRMSTSVPGVFAAGDITGGLKQIIVAAGEGAIAGTSAFEYLMEPYWTENH